MASTIKVDTVTTPDGTGNITISRPIVADGTNLTNLPAANLTGTLPAISGASLTNLPINPSRNFIIDGDFTQWPEGATFTSAVSSAYTSALWEYIAVGGGGVCTVNRSTDVPTVAQSNHQSSYSLQVDVTTADTSIDASHFYALRHIITGSDYALLHSQVVTLQFWVKSTKTGVFTVVFGNGAQNRSLPYEYTVNTTNTWEKKEITVTLDNTGTWLFTEADKGLSLEFVIATGSDLEDGTHNTWGGSHEYGEGDNVNGMDSTSNNFFLSQVGLYKGSTAPSSFVGESIATVKNQVDYYVQRYDLNSSSYETSGFSLNCRSSTHAKATMNVRSELRTSPTVTSSAASTWSVNSGANDGTPSAITFSAGGRTGWNIDLTVSGRTTGHSGYLYRNGATAGVFIMFDARH